MVQLSVYAFIPFEIFLATTIVSIAITIWIKLAARPAPARVSPARSAQVLQFPAPAPRRRVASTAAQHAAQHSTYRPHQALVTG